MIQQAGIYKLDLYENKDVVLTFDSNDDITAISNSGDVLNFETDYNDPKYSNDKEPGKNNIVINKHKILFHIDTLDQSNFDIIEKLQSSIYGWVVLIEFFSGDKYIINIPFFPEIDKLNSQVSHTFDIEMNPRIETTEELQNYVS